MSNDIDFQTHKIKCKLSDCNTYIVVISYHKITTSRYISRFSAISRVDAAGEIFGNIKPRNNELVSKFNTLIKRDVEDFFKQCH